MTKKRKSPIKHKVKSYKRKNGKKVQSYTRGKDSKVQKTVSPKISFPYGRPLPNDWKKGNSTVGSLNRFKNPKSSLMKVMKKQLMRNSWMLDEHNIGGFTTSYYWVDSVRDLKNSEVAVRNIRETRTLFSPSLDAIANWRYKKLEGKVTPYNRPEKVWYDTVLDMWVVEDFTYG